MKKKLAEIAIAFVIVATLSGLYYSYKTQNHVVSTNTEATQAKTKKQPNQEQLVTGTVKVSVDK